MTGKEGEKRALEIRLGMYHFLSDQVQVLIFGYWYKVI